jgi:hypothetical protein
LNVSRNFGLRLAFTGTGLFTVVLLVRLGLGSGGLMGRPDGVLFDRPKAGFDPLEKLVTSPILENVRSC